VIDYCVVGVLFSNCLRDVCVVCTEGSYKSSTSVLSVLPLVLSLFIFICLIGKEMNEYAGFYVCDVFDR